MSPRWKAAVALSGIAVAIAATYAADPGTGRTFLFVAAPLVLLVAAGAWAKAHGGPEAVAQIERAVAIQRTATQVRTALSTLEDEEVLRFEDTWAARMLSPSDRGMFGPVDAYFASLPTSERAAMARQFFSRLPDEDLCDVYQVVTGPWPEAPSRSS